MAKRLNTLKTGLIESQDFLGGLNSNWVLSPSNANVSYNNGMIISPENHDVSLIRNITEKCCVIDICNDFVPASDVDKAIISIFENNDESLDIEEYYDNGVVNTYPYIRIVKDYNYYSFYASEVFGQWEFIGSQQIDYMSPKLKITLCGGGNIEYKLQKIDIYTNTEIEITNVNSGDVVEIVDSTTGEIYDSKTVLSYRNSCKLDVSKIENSVKVKVQIKNTNGIYFDSVDMNIWGGDKYHYFYTIGLYDYDTNQEFVPLVLSPLGGISGDYIEKKIRMDNQSGFSFTKCRVSVKKKDDDSYQYVEIAKFVSGNPGPYSQSINLNGIANGGQHIFYLKVNREMTGMYTNIQFELEVEVE